ncbi:MAG: UDP-N-acetylmuramoyl-L-alanyl-D-glutamate--2,6-diaminopimelate ligase [Candidatus Cybelea sp.]
MAAEPNVALATLLKRLEKPLAVLGDRNRNVNAIEINSRRVKPGALFVALRGAHTDGHRHANDAAGKGAHVVVVERAVDLPAGVTVVQVANSRRALSALAAAFYGDPSHSLDVIGVTGTNGKTTTTHMIAAVLNAAGISCGIAGTVGAEFRTRRWLLENTTPQPPELQRLLARMHDAGAKAVAMEVSSHALALDRAQDVRFRVAALTNVTRDHLDFHETIEAYAAAKRRLFSLAPASVINADDQYGERWESELRGEGRSVISYGLRSAANLVPEELAVEPSGSRFTVNGQRYQLRLPGRFNIWNALAAIGVARFLGVDDATSARGLSELERVPGRMERLDGGDIAVVVDYAHTPDALESALRSLRETASGALIVVFGCGGDRDRGKRPEMGAVGAVFADRLYVTSDNPRTEDPQTIVDAIVAGIGDRERIVELDRRRAIERAIAEARSGDVVLIAGKGHETYQIVGDRVLPFDDAAVAREALGSRSVLR